MLPVDPSRLGNSSETFQVNEKIRSGYCRSAVSGGHRLGAGKANEIEAFVKVCALLLRREQETGVFSANINVVDDVRIFIHGQYISYTNPDTKNIEYVDLLSIEDDPFKTALEEYYSLSGAKKFQKNWIVAGNSKGDFSGPIPLDKKFDGALMELPNNLVHTFLEMLPQKLLELPSPEQREVFIRRLLFIEFIHPKLYEKISLKLRQRELALKGPGNDTQMNTLQSEIQRLRSLQDKLKNFDFYALSKALLAAPIGHIWSGNRDALALSLTTHIENEINAKRSWWDRAVANKPLSSVQKEYAQDIGGMLYMDRGRYFTYCNKYNCKIKREVAPDIFLREAIKFANGGTYNAEGFKKSSLTYSFGDQLKDEINREFEPLAVLASHAIGHRQGDEYEFPEYPANASPEEKQKIDQQRKEVLKRQILAHRARVNHSLTLEQIHSSGGSIKNEQLAVGTTMRTPLPGVSISRSGSHSNLILVGDPVPQTIPIPSEMQGAVTHLQMNSRSGSPEKTKG